jgi:hypothetical protein
MIKLFLANRSLDKLSYFGFKIRLLNLVNGAFVWFLIGSYVVAEAD